jgi:hypothetical protein
MTRGAVVKRLAWASMYMIVPVLGLFGAFRWLDWRAERVVTGELPSGFPLVILREGRPKAIFAGDLRESPADCAKPERTPEPPKYTNPVFLSPSAASPATGWQRIDAPDCGFDKGSYGRYRVVNVSRGQFAMEVDATCSEDYMNVGRYQVAAGTVRGLSYKHYFGPGAALVSLPAAGCLTLLGWLSLFVGGRVGSWRQIRRASTQQSRP